MSLWPTKGNENLPSEGICVIRRKRGEVEYDWQPTPQVMGWVVIVFKRPFLR